jgi:phenylacetate-CoA ligase
VCGETGPRYTLLGRHADAVEIDGRMLLPLDVHLALEDIEPDGPEFQLVAGGERRLQLRVEAEDGRGGHLAGALEEALGVPTAVETVPIGSLPRASFKPRRVA